MRDSWNPLNLLINHTACYNCPTEIQHSKHTVTDQFDGGRLWDTIYDGFSQSTSITANCWFFLGNYSSFTTSLEICFVPRLRPWVVPNLSSLAATIVKHHAEAQWYANECTVVYYDALVCKKRWNISFKQSLMYLIIAAFPWDFERHHPQHQVWRIWSSQDFDGFINMLDVKPSNRKRELHLASFEHFKPTKEKKHTIS